MDQIDVLFEAVAKQKLAHGPTLGCLYTGDAFPPHCAPMPRSPIPNVGMLFDESFPEMLKAAIGLNPAIHDGAVMIGRTSSAEAYRIRGWSFRLFPPDIAISGEPNRGAAYNSCLAMSAIAGVDKLYLVSGNVVRCFFAGNARQLAQPDG